MVNLMIQMNSVNRNGILSLGSKYIRHRKLAYAHPEEECSAVLSMEYSEITRISEFLFVLRDKKKICLLRDIQVDVCCKETPVPSGQETGRDPEPVWMLWRRKEISCP
jgi:hypothetical protein